MPLKFTIIFCAKVGTTDAFLNIMKSVKTDLPTADGCSGVEILRSIENPSEFTLIESWESQHKHQTHIQTLTESGGWDYLLGLLTHTPNGHYHHLI